MVINRRPVRTEVTNHVFISSLFLFLVYKLYLVMIDCCTSEAPSFTDLTIALPRQRASYKISRV